MQAQQALHFLKEIPLFENADNALLSECLALPACSIQTAASGDRIENTEQRALIVILEGRVKIRSTDGERNVILRTAKQGEVLGAASLFLKQAPPLSTIEASGNCRVLFMQADAVRHLLQKDFRFLDDFLAFLAGRVRFLNQKIRCFTAGSAERRLALWLAGEESDTLTLPDSLTSLADTLDIGRASLYRALDKLEQDGYILRKGREIQLLSREEIFKKYQ